jgi:pimeloyl-ACP methyl ester carboxylesterase
MAAWMREKQPPLLVIWGKYDLSFELSEPEAYRRDEPNAQVHVLDAGHFALDTLRMRSQIWCETLPPRYVG